MSKSKSNISKKDLVASMDKLSVFVARYRILLIFMLGSVAILMALLQTRSLLNPSRNETQYEEGIKSINYTTINQDIVNKLKSTQNDQAILVNPELVPDRNNPFSE